MHQRFRFSWLGPSSALAPAMLVFGCMLSPTNGQMVGPTTSSVAFSGYHLYPDAGVTVQALNASTSAWETVARTRSSASTGLSLGPDPLYAWSASAPLPARFWTPGSRGRGGKASVRTSGETVAYGVQDFVSVERDWGRCYASLDSPSKEAFYSECRSSRSPVAEIVSSDYVAPAWGIADLHAHPATHLAFGGATTPGGARLFWGMPGLALGSSDVATDLPSCATDKHDGFDGDAVRHSMRTRVVGTVDAQTGLPHQPGGAPHYTGWPHASSLLHQQMHVSWIHRAYRGGIRLMFASATDNELLDMLYHRGYNYFGDPTPVPSATHNADSARRQIEFIRRLASANESWLEVVSTSRDARRAIQQGKLALVLSVELDNLTPAQVCALRDTGVRHIVPIHFANNAFGGTAVTGPVVLPPGTPGANPFNVANWWLSGGPGGGQYFSLVRDWRILYREGRPEYLHYHRFDFLQGGAVEPRPVSDAIFAGLGYASGPTSWGHRNARGADVGLIFNLMRQGFMIDLSHMSEVSAEDTVSLAQLIGFPLMSSHTGLRSDTAAGSSERQLLERHARAIASLGGVIGLGTGRSGASDQLLAWAQTYSDARRVLGSASIALGTDFNGLQEQMTTTGRTSTYPIQVAARRAPLGLAATAPALTQHVLGTRVFNGLTDGLAHYGMIPEFLQAVESTPPTPAGRLSGSTIVDELFQSAEATLVYWERVEEATQRLWGGAASCP